MHCLPPPTPRVAFRDGATAVAPILLGVVPFGLVAGVAAVEAGLGMPEAIGFSVLVFAGAAQLAAIELLGGGATIVVAVMTALIVNLRMAMYSAALAAELSAEPLGKRVLSSYLLTDQAFAVSLARYRTDPLAGERWWFYTGSAVALWVAWQLTTVLGVVIGDTVPEAIPLAFAVPLAFLCLLVPSITDHPALAAAMSAGAIAVIAAPLPANLGMPLATLTGILVGWLLARRGDR